MTKNSLFDNDEPLTPQEAGNYSKIKELRKIASLVIPILIVIIGAVFFFFNVLRAPKQTTINTGQEQPKTTENAELEPNTYLDLDVITVALTPSGSKREFLRMDITLRLGSNAESNAILDKMPIIRDSLITFLKTLRATDFNSSSSTLFLKEEIIKRLNKIVAPVVIKEVLFQEITVN